MRVESTPDTSEDQHTSKGDSSPFGVRVPVARVARRPWLAGGILVALCLAVYLPGLFSLPVVDRDEARFAQASRQMFESVALAEDQRDPGLHAGGLAVPMVQDKPRLNKPPLIYWLQAGSAAIFTLGDPMADAIWMYRVPSVVAGIVTVLVTWRLGSFLARPEVGFLAGTIMSMSPVFVWEAHQARADMVLVACTIVAMWMLWKIWSNATEGNRVGIGSTALLWVAIAAGVMTKGPITPMVVGLSAITISTITGRWGWLKSTRPILGIAVVALLVTPWVVGVARHVGFDAYLSIISDEVLGRSLEPKEGHSGPPAYHLLLMPVLLWPGSMLVGVAAIWAWKKAFGRKSTETGRKWILRVNQTREAAGLAFVFAWIVPAWIVFELVSTKLPHYTMPLYPALAIMCAAALWASAKESLPGAKHSVTTAALVIWSFLGIGFAIVVSGLMVLFLGGHWHEPPPYWAPLVPLLGFGTAVMAIVPTLKRKFLESHIYWVACALLTFVSLIGFGLPAREDLWITKRISQSALAARSSDSPPIAAAGFHEDSLVYYTRGRIEFISAADTLAWATAHTGGIIIARVPDAPCPPTYETTSFVSGFRYTKGERADLCLFVPPPNAP